MITLPIPTETSHSVRGPAQGSWTYADWEKLPDDGNRYEIIEVISPGSADYDEGVKLEAYAKAGVPEYGVIDPATRKLRLYVLEAPGKFAAPREFGEGDSLSFACLPDIVLNVSDLFANAPDTTV